MVFLTDQQATEYFHRSHKAADGLWFMKVEEKYGFDSALEIDKEVWKVLPKIQARMIKSMLRKDGAEANLLESLEEKLSLEGFRFRVLEKDDRGFRITISYCPWHDLMVKSRREKLSGRVGTAVCSAEYSVWASEFGEDIEFTFGMQKCQGSGCCIMNFEKADSTENKPRSPTSA